MSAPPPAIPPSSFPRGPGGRPTREEAERRHRALLDAAARLFIANGLDGVSLEAIAEEAGVAKRFVYARYRDKGELFTDAVRRLIEQRLSFIGAYEVGPAAVEQGLLAFAGMLEAAATQPEALALYRLIVTELHRFPALNRLFTDKMRLTVLGSVTRVLDVYRARGELRFDDAALTTELFVTLIVQGARGRALLGTPQTADEKHRRTEAAIRLFLDGCRARG